MDAVERKMRRRIRRQIETGKKQARVRQVDAKTFEYALKYRVSVVRFRIGKANVNGRFTLIRIK